MPDGHAMDLTRSNFSCAMRLAAVKPKIDRRSVRSFRSPMAEFCDAVTRCEMKAMLFRCSALRSLVEKVIGFCMDEMIFLFIISIP